MFSTMRDCESNIKRHRGSRVSQRWLVTVCLHCEKGFRHVKGFSSIPNVIAAIEAEQVDDKKLSDAA